MLELNEFIKKYVTKRKESMFNNDTKLNREKMINKITDKSILVIGGAGSIGSSFIQAYSRIWLLKKH